MTDVGERFNLVNLLTKPLSDSDLLQIAQTPQQHCNAETTKNLAITLQLARIVIRSLRERMVAVPNNIENLVDAYGEACEMCAIQVGESHSWENEKHRLFRREKLMAALVAPPTGERK